MREACLWIQEGGAPMAAFSVEAGVSLYLYRENACVY